MSVDVSLLMLVRVVSVLSAAALVVSCGAIDGAVGSMYSEVADDGVAAVNPDSGVKWVKVNVVVDAGLGVVLHVNYIPARDRRRTPGCFYTTSFIEGAQAFRSAVRSFPLKEGVNSVRVPVDEILPGWCHFEPHMSFEVADVTTGAKAPSAGSAIVLHATGSEMRPLEIVECRVRRNVQEPRISCMSEWARLPILEERAAQAKVFHAPVATGGGELSVEFRVRGPWGEQEIPSLQTGPAAGGRPAEFQR